MRLPPDLEAKVLALAGAQAPRPTPVSEKEFQAAVVNLARRNGWRCFHCHDSRKSEAGFPDLVLVRDRVVWAELKAEAGRLSAAQLAWVEALRAAGTEVHVWRPTDWPEIERILS